MPDLVVGARRSHTRLRWRSKLIGVGFVALTLIVGFLIFRRVVTYPHPDVSLPRGRPTLELGAETPSVRYGGAALTRRGSIDLVSLRGDIEGMGAQHGRLLRSRVREVLRTLQPMISRTQKRSGLFGGITHGHRMRWKWRLLDDGLPGHQLVELAAVAAAARVDYEALVRANAALDIGAPAAHTPGARMKTRTRALTALIGGEEADGRLLIARSFAVIGSSDGGEAIATRPVVFAVHGDDAISFLSVGWPGMTGVVSGINAEGLSIFVHPFDSADVRVTRDAQPAPLIAREVLESARSGDEAVSVLERAEIAGAARFVVIDAKARSWALVERSPTRRESRRQFRPAVAGDLPRSPAFEDDSLVKRAQLARPVQTREKRLAELVSRAEAIPEAVATILRDQRLPGGLAAPIGHRGVVEDFEAAHAIIIDPIAMAMWISDGPGATGRFRAIDLRYFLVGQGERPVPPEDIPATTDRRAQLIMQARRELRQAARERASGRISRARERTERAVALVPNLPEALLLAGDLARKAGDLDQAHELYRRYLDNGPDDPGAVDQVEAQLGR